MVRTGLSANITLQYAYVNYLATSYPDPPRSARTPSIRSNPLMRHPPVGEAKVCASNASISRSSRPDTVFNGFDLPQWRERKGGDDVVSNVGYVTLNAFLPLMGITFGHIS